MSIDDQRRVAIDPFETPPVDPVPAEPPELHRPHESSPLRGPSQAELERLRVADTALEHEVAAALRSVEGDHPGAKADAIIAGLERRLEQVLAERDELSLRYSQQASECRELIRKNEMLVVTKHAFQQALRALVNSGFEDIEISS